MRLETKRLLLFGFIFFAGCPSEIETPIQAPLVQQTENPQAEQLFNEAVELFNTEKMAEAEIAFALFQKQFPTDPLFSQVSVYRGRIAMMRGNITEARRVFLSVFQIGTEDSAYDYARMYLGLCEYELQNYSRAIEYLTPYAGRFANQEENLKVLRTLWNSAAAMNDWQQQIVWMEQALSAEPGENEQAQILATVSNLAALKTESELKQAVSKLNEKDRIWTILMAQLAHIQFENEQYNEATEIVQEIKESGIQNAVSISDLIELIDKRNKVDIRTIGCLLPLSGKMRLVGQDTLKGVMLAARRNRFGRENAPLSVVMKDTAAGEKRAEEIVEELVMKDRVSAIIGPMDASFSKAAAHKAQRLGVPMILLSADEKISASGNYIFRKFASNQKELEALFKKYRLGSKTLSAGGAPSFAVLYPLNGYGKLMKKSFKAELKETEKLVVEIGFEPTLMDFKNVAEQLAHKDFTALFLPMTAEQLALAAPALSAAGIWPSEPQKGADVHVATYLIPSVGFSTSLISRSSRYLQGALFVADFKTDRSASIQSFVRIFQNEYKASPSTFAAFGYDAALLISNAVNSGISSRRDMRTWLDEVVASDGLVFPFAGFNENGDAASLPTVLTLVGTELNH